MVWEQIAGRLVGMGLGKVSDAVSYARANPRDRILESLFGTYGVRLNMSKRDFLLWTDYPNVIDPIDDLLSGAAPDRIRAPLALAIEAHLLSEGKPLEPGIEMEISESVIASYAQFLKNPDDVNPTLVRKMDEVTDRVQGLSTTNDRGVESERDLLNALVVGPLEIVGQSVNAERANELASSGDEKGAATLLAGVADSLDAAGFANVADSFRTRAAHLFEEAGENEAAIELLVDAAWNQIHRCERGAQITTASLERLLPDDPFSKGMVAASKWPRNPAACGLLKEASNSPRGGPHQLALLEMLGRISTVEEEPHRVETELGHFAFTGDPSTSLSISLDVVDAAGAIHGTSEEDEMWNKLLNWIGASNDPALQGLIWSRRGFALARRGDYAGSITSYRISMEAWARSADGAENAAEAFYSSQRAAHLRGDWFPDGHELRPLAYEIRGRSNTKSAIGDRLLSEASSERIGGSFPEAHDKYLLALESYRHAGSLDGYLRTVARLAELYEASGHTASAVKSYVHAGEGKKAARLVANVDESQLVDALQPTDSPWIRTAMYHALRALGGRAPSDSIETLAPALLSDARGGGDWDPRLGIAKSALASTFLLIPELLQEEALIQIRSDLAEERFLDASRDAAIALMNASWFGVSDETELLCMAFVEGRTLNDISPAWIAECVPERHLTKYIVPRAREGNEQALTVLALADGYTPDSGMRAVADLKLDAWISAITHEHAVTKHGESSVSHHLGIDFASGGVLARIGTDLKLRQFVERMLEIALDVKDFEQTRASALDGIFNVLECVEPDQRDAIVSDLSSLIRGDYSRRDDETNEVDPLSRFQISMFTADVLWISAVQVAGRAASLGSDDSEFVLLVSRIDGLPAPIRAAVLGELGRIANLEVPGGISRFLFDADSGVRRNAVAALALRPGSGLDGHYERLIMDSSLPVRRVTIDAAAEQHRLDVLQAAASSDPDVALRRIAERNIDADDGPATSDQS